jgi:hypothetical protein
MRISPIKRGARFSRYHANMSFVQREFYVDDAGVPRAQAAQFLANGTGIVSVIEPRLALTISGPPAIPAGIPTSDPRIGSGSKCDAVRHYALAFCPAFKGDCDRLVLTNFQRWSIPNPIGTKKDTTFEGSCAESTKGRGLPKATCSGTRHSQRPEPALAAGGEWRSVGTGPTIPGQARVGREGFCLSTTGSEPTEAGVARS